MDRRTRVQREDLIRSITPKVVDSMEVPYGMRVIVLAKVVRQIKKKSIKLILICLTLIASSLFGLGLLAVTAIKPTSVMQTLQRLLDGWMEKDPSSIPVAWPVYEPTVLPDLKPED